MKRRWRMVLGAILVPVALRVLDIAIGGNVNPSVEIGVTEPFLLLLLATMELGVLLAVTSDRGLGVTTTLVAAVALFLVGGSHPTSFFDFASEPLFLVALGMTVGSLEATARFPAIRRFLTTREGTLALAVGVVHVCVGFGLKWLERGDQFTPYQSAIGSLTWLVFAVVLLVLGTLAMALYLRHRVVSPLAVLVGWAGWAVVEAWEMSTAGRLPLHPALAETHSGLTPFPDYVHHVPSILAVALVVIAVELLLRNVVGASNRDSTPTPE